LKLPPQLPPNLPKKVPEPSTSTKQKVKPKRISKAELINRLRELMTSEQWELIAELRGIPIPATDTKKDNFLTSIFKKKITISSAKGKARNLQQWLARKISEFTGVPCGKDEEIASREMGQAGADVRMSRRVCVMFPFTSECKSGDQWSLPNAIKQCKANLYDGTEWLVCIDRPSIHPEQRISPIIIIDGNVFFKILNRCGELVDLCQMNSNKSSDKK
jgi:hypothetical protein